MMHWLNYPIPAWAMVVGGLLGRATWEIGNAWWRRRNARTFARRYFNSFGFNPIGRVNEVVFDETGIRTEATVSPEMAAWLRHEWTERWGR